MKKQLDINAKKALDEMKLEMANELNTDLTNFIRSGKARTHRPAEMDQNPFPKNDIPDTFNPS